MSGHACDFTEEATTFLIIYLVRDWISRVNLAMANWLVMCTLQKTMSWCEERLPWDYILTAFHHHDTRANLLVPHTEEKQVQFIDALHQN